MESTQIINSKFTEITNKFLCHKHFTLFLSVVLLAWTVQTNPFIHTENLGTGFWNLIIGQSHSLLHNDFLLNLSFGINRALKLSYPLIIKVLHISQPWQIFLLQLLFCLLLQFLLVRLCLKISNNNRLGTALFTFICSICYFSSNAAGDTFGHADMLAFLLIIIILSTKNLAIIFLNVILALFTNERVLVLAIPTLLFYDFDERKKTLIVIMIGVCVYFAIKYYLNQQPHFNSITFPYDVRLPQLISTHVYNIYVYAFGGLWLLIVYWMYLIKKIPLVVLIILPLSLCSFIVADCTRGLSFIFPIFLITLKNLYSLETRDRLNKLMMVAAIVSIILPNAIYFGEFWYRESLFSHVVGGNLQFVFKKAYKLGINLVTK